jgi:hypothetical protein
MKPDGYDSYDKCIKFVLNSCRNAHGTMDEQKCGPINKLAGWKNYCGLASQLDCSTDHEACICDGALFLVSSHTAMNLTLAYCSMEPPASDRKSELFDQAVGALATFCKEAGLTPKSYQAEVEGDADSVGRFGDMKAPSKFLLPPPALVVVLFQVSDH